MRRRFRAVDDGESGLDGWVMEVTLPHELVKGPAIRRFVGRPPDGGIPHLGRHGMILLEDLRTA